MILAAICTLEQGMPVLFLLLFCLSTNIEGNDRQIFML